MQTVFQAVRLIHGSLLLIVNRLFKSQECFDQHKQTIGQGKSLCTSIAKCDQCHNVVKRGRLRYDLHHCGQTKCSTTCSQ